MSHLVKAAFGMTIAVGLLLAGSIQAATVYGVNTSGEIRSFTGAQNGANPIEGNTFAGGTLEATVAAYGSYLGFTQSPDGTVYGVNSAGGVDSWATLVAWLAGTAAMVESSGVYGTDGIHGCSYDENTDGFYVVYEGSGLDGDIGEYATLNDFINNQNAAVSEASYGGNILNFYYPGNDSSAASKYYQVAGNGRLEGFTTLASYIADANNRTDHSGLSAFNNVGAAFAVVEVEATELLPPDALTAVATNGSVRLDWASGQGAPSYNIYRSTNSGSYGSPLQTGETSLSYVDSSVTEYATYYYTVTSVSNGAESVASDEASVLVPGVYNPPNNLNIVFIFIDDIGWGDLSCYGSTATTKTGGAITPNMDQLAAEGIRFTDGYVGAPVCSPSRVSVLTGMEAQRYAIHAFLNDTASNDARSMNDWLDQNAMTTARLFKDAGYATGLFGKWHMGGGRDVNDAPFPQEYGFDESLTSFEGMGDRILYLDDGTPHGLSSQNADVPGSVEWVEWEIGADKFTDAAIGFITGAVASNKNFYVHVPHDDTHAPYDTDPEKLYDFDHISTHANTRLFLSELHELDKEIGRLVQAIDALGAGSNTLVVVVGDNGAPNDTINANVNRNGGLRGGKNDLWEGGIREPFFIRWPEGTPSGVVNSSTAVSTLDLLPTYCALAGIPLPDAPFAGEDMSDVFTGSTRSRQRPLFWEYGAITAMPNNAPDLAMRDGNLKLLMDAEGSNAKLYNMDTDKEETINLIGDAGLQNTVSNMQAQLLGWYHKVVLGEIGEPVSVTNAAVSPGVVIYDDYTVTGGNAPNPGFGANDGVNYEFASRVSGMAATNLTGYWYNTGSRPATDFSITGNRLSAVPDNANGRFEFSANGSSGFDFGSWLAGNIYELSVQMDIDVVGATYAQRMSLSLADASGLAIQEIDLGIQIGTDGAGGLGVFKRMDAGSNSGGRDINTMVASGYAIGTPLDLKIVVQDFNSNTTDYASSYEIFVNGASVDSGSFRFNGSSSARYLIFDTAAHEGYIYYDEVKLEVTEVGGPTVSYVYPPRLAFSLIGPDRIHWNAQPASVYEPQSSTNLIDWISHGLVTNEFGTIQWLEPTGDQGAARFFRLK